VADIADLIADLDALLEPDRFRDLGPNGLQVPGTREVRRVLTAVSAQRAVSEAAVAHDAQLVLVHHGLFWDFLPTGLSPVLAERLRPLLRHDVNLAAYHLPLDAHPEVGNNAILARELGCAEQEPFGAYRGVPVGRRGTFPGDGVAIEDLIERVTADAGEAGIHFIAAGHAATETFGVRALGDRLAERFGIEHVFAPVPNPV
jgi:putative NIF3 family GTP cyclohydrolase 1 type 2